MNLFNVIGKSHVSGVMLPAAVLLTFSATLITLAYMDRMMDKKTDIGVIGLGAMGGSFAINLINKHFNVKTD